MAGHAQIDYTVLALRTKSYRLPLLAGAVLCLVSGWYFGRVIASSALGPNAPTVQQGLLPEWIGCRQILHGQNPYRLEVTREIEMAIYGETVAPDSPANQHRFAYPVFFSLLFFPIAMLPFDAAQSAMLLAGIAATAMSVVWWAEGKWLGKLDAASFAILAFAAYPAVVALQLRQPTLIIAALLSLAFFCARSGRLVAAGIAAALAASKPQLAIAVLLPLLIWAFSSWRIRKTFVFSLAASGFGLLLISELAVPGWVLPWLGTIRAYSHYAGAKPLLEDLTRGHFLMPAAVLVILAVVWVSFTFSDTDLLFAISFSIVSFHLLFPFQLYNEVMLLPAALWAVKNANRICERGELHVLLFSCAWIALAAGWISTLALSLWDIASPGAGLRLWQLPLVTAWLYPMLLFAALATFAASSLLEQQRARLRRIIPA